MSHRSIGPGAMPGLIMASQPAIRALSRNTVGASASSTASSKTSTTKNDARQRLTLLGVSSIALVALLYARPAIETPGARAPVQNAVQTASAPVQPAAAAALPAVDHVAPAAAVARPDSHRQQQAVTSWLSKRYRVAGDAANMLVSTAYVTAKDVKLDPLLILAVMAIESGLNPFAESPVGAKGLMQVMANIHHAKFQAMGGPQTALNPVANIRVGSQILKEYVARGGSVEAGLKSYVGAGAFETDSGYGSRVMAELHMLKMVANGKKVPTYTRNSAPVIVQKAAPREEAAPALTAPTVTTEQAIAGL